MHHIEHGMQPKEATIKAMEEVSGPVDRDRPDPHRGVRAGRLHGRHHRAAVSAVRDHDRAVGAAVGRQRADAQPGAGGHAAQGADREEDAADAVLQLLQQVVRPRHRRLRQLLGDPDPEDVPQPRVHRRADVRDRRPGPADPRRLRAGGGPGLHHGQRPAARRGVARADRRRHAEGRGDPGEERGDRRLQHDQRLLAAHRRVLLEHGLLLRAAQAVGGAEGPRGARQGSRQRAERGVRAGDPGRAGAGVRAARDSGSRHRRRLHHAAAGSQRRRRRSTWPIRRSASWRRRASGRRSDASATLYRASRAAGVRRHRSQQGAEVRRAN